MSFDGITVTSRSLIIWLYSESPATSQHHHHYIKLLSRVIYFNLWLLSSTIISSSSSLSLSGLFHPERTSNVYILHSTRYHLISIVNCHGDYDRISNLIILFTISRGKMCDWSSSWFRVEKLVELDYSPSLWVNALVWGENEELR